MNSRSYVFWSLGILAATGFMLVSCGNRSRFAVNPNPRMEQILFDTRDVTVYRLAAEPHAIVATFKRYQLRSNPNGPLLSAKEALATLAETDLIRVYHMSVTLDRQPSSKEDPQLKDVPSAEDFQRWASLHDDGTPPPDPVPGCECPYGPPVCCHAPPGSIGCEVKCKYHEIE